MTEDATLDTGELVESITPDELKERIDGGEQVFLLDTRSEENFEEWKIEGSNVEIINYPYFELLNGLPPSLLAALPDDRKITVVCAKGGASEMVAEQLEAEGYDANHLVGGMNGWARVYEYTELDVGGELTVAQYQRPSSGCLAYLVVSAGEAVVIDPLRAFTEEYLQDARALGAELTHALDTHIHADHISGVRALAEEAELEAVLPGPATERGVDYEIPYTTVSDGDVLSVGDINLEVIHTPGHTTGMTAYRVDDVLFTGDGLFTESVARPDLEDPAAATNAARVLYESLTEKILSLPDDTTIAPAHFNEAATRSDDGSYTAELGDLRGRMDALSMDEDSFVEFIVADLPPQPANYEEIIPANLGQQSLDEVEAFELELGPNNCAVSDGALTN